MVFAAVDAHPLGVPFPALLRSRQTHNSSAYECSASFEVALSSPRLHVRLAGLDDLDGWFSPYALNLLSACQQFIQSFSELNNITVDGDEGRRSIVKGLLDCREYRHFSHRQSRLDDPEVTNLRQAKALDFLPNAVTLDRDTFWAAVTAG